MMLKVKIVVAVNTLSVAEEEESAQTLVSEGDIVGDASRATNHTYEQTISHDDSICKVAVEPHTRAWHYCQ